MASGGSAACALGQSALDQILGKQPKPLNDQKKEEAKKKVPDSLLNKSHSSEIFFSPGPDVLRAV